MKKNIFKVFLLLLILPCVALLSACSNSVYVKSIVKSANGYVVHYSDGSKFEISNIVTNVNYTIDDLKNEWEETAQPGETFSDYLIANSNLVLTHNIGIEELKSAWEQDFEDGLITSTFSEFLASFADLTHSINNALFNVVSIVSTFTYTTSAYDVLQGKMVQTEHQTQGAGSGVIYTLDTSKKEAYIITNYHVVYDSEYSNSVSNDIKICVYGKEDFSDGSTTSISAKFVGGSDSYDIAVLKVDNNSTNSNILFSGDYTECLIEDSNNIYVGEQIYALGNPKGAGLSAVTGVVSVDSEHILINETTEETAREIRISAPVNPGNSGGGLFNAKGKLIGIVNAKLVDESIEGISYAIPINVATAVADNIIKTCNGANKTKGTFVKVGLTIIRANSQAVKDEKTGLSKIKEEVVVHEISADGLLKNTNMVVGDKIVSIKYKREQNSDWIDLLVTRNHILTDAVLSCYVGGSVIFCVEHENGAQENIQITFTQNDVRVVN